MGDIADALRAPNLATASPVRNKRTAPTGFEPGVKYLAGEPSEVTLSLAEIPEGEQQWRDEIKRVTNLDLPDHRKVEVAQVRYWGDPQQPLVYVRFVISDRSVASGTVDIAELLGIARANRRAIPKAASSTRTRMVGLSDEQIGKTDRNGGTEAFWSRVGDLTAQLDAEMVRVPCADAVVIAGGDLIEGFESHGGQAFTNDRSHPESLAEARAYVTHMITAIASRHEHTRVLAVPSNHAAWRKGKDYLGKPSDDYGLDVYRAVAEALARDPHFAERVTFIFPEPWEVSLAVTVRDDIVGVTHGHVGTTGALSFRRWFDGQLRGDAPVAAATIIYSGHFHHFIAEPLGAVNGRERTHFQMPALDGGSGHFTNATGEQSEPGILTHVINDGGGWDHLRVLRAQVTPRDLTTA